VDLPHDSVCPCYGQPIETGSLHSVSSPLLWNAVCTLRINSIHFSIGIPPVEVRHALDFEQQSMSLSRCHLIRNQSRILRGVCTGTATALTIAFKQSWRKQFKGGLNFLATDTCPRRSSDAATCLTAAASGATVHQACWLWDPSDYKLASFDIRNVFHFSGGYELPFGQGKRSSPMRGLP